MANLVKRAQAEEEKKQVPLPKYQAECVVDGSIVTFKLNLDEIAAMAVEREGERDENGTKVRYTKNPAVMLQGIAKGVQVIQRNPADGLDYLMEIDFVLGQGGNGVYAPITRTKVIGELKPEVA
jgi:hypothetical protein